MTDLLRLTVDGLIRTRDGFGPTSISFRWWSGDPLAVTLLIPAGELDEVEWWVGRDLLGSGLRQRREPVGSGNVRVFRAPGNPGLAVVCLTSGQEWCQLHVRAGLVREWLAETYRAVPAGAVEVRCLDLDAELAELLRSHNTGGRSS